MKLMHVVMVLNIMIMDVDGGRCDVVGDMGDGGISKRGGRAP